MRWRGRRGSTNVEDRRGRSPLGGRGVPIGCGGILVVIVIALLTGQNPQKLLEMVGDSQVMVDPGASVSTGGGAPSDELGLCVRLQLGGDRTVLLPARRQALHRSRGPT